MHRNLAPSAPLAERGRYHPRRGVSTVSDRSCGTVALGGLAVGLASGFYCGMDIPRRRIHLCAILHIYVVILYRKGVTHCVKMTPPRGAPPMARHGVSEVVRWVHVLEDARGEARRRDLPPAVKSLSRAREGIFSIGNH